MQITAYCPSCHSPWHLDASMLGKRLRCPNPRCREIFEVREAEPEPAYQEEPGRAFDDLPVAPVVDGEPGEAGDDRRNPHSGSQLAGSVGDIVPILEAEAVEDEGPAPTVISAEEMSPLRAEAVEPGAPAESASWEQPPPVRNPNATHAEEPAPSPAGPRTAAEAAAEAAPSWQMPPPVRRPGTDGYTEGAGNGEPAPAATGVYEDLYPEEPTQKSRMAVWMIAGMVTVTCLLVGAVFFRYKVVSWLTERRLVNNGEEAYAQGKFADAFNNFDQVAREFPKSDKVADYRFMAELSRLRDKVSQPGDPRLTQPLLDDFRKVHEKEPLFKKHAAEFADARRRLAEGYLDKAVEDDRHDRAMLEDAKRLLSRGDSEDRPLLQRIDQAEQQFHQWEVVKDAREQIGTLAKTPNQEGLTRAYQIARANNLTADPDVKSTLERMTEEVYSSVPYVAAQSGDNVAVPPEPVEPSVFLAPVVSEEEKRTSAPSNQGGPTAARAAADRDAGVWLALARGVLYALDQQTGTIRWTIRVGIDTTALPVRLPRTPSSPELFLVLSADRNTLMALRARDGTVSWQHELRAGKDPAAPALGRPTVISLPGQRPLVYVATYDGKVHEIETAQGNLLGYFAVGQHLTVGGVWQRGTDLLFVPGDRDFVYVLDLALTHGPSGKPRKKRCVAILRSDHPSGSLRSEPIIVNRIDPFAARQLVAAQGGEALAPEQTRPYLILSQADGLNQMRLRVFELPISNDSKPADESEPLHGWSWFRPYHDSEKLAFVTDRGVFGLYGINQVRNTDAPIFPEFLQEQYLAEGSTGLGRGQVVHATENDFWVLANGLMQRLYFNLFDPKGPRVVPVWTDRDGRPRSLALGSPLHASQRDEAGKVLFVVTQDRSRQIYLATAVEAATGTIRWQRQLGLESQGDPLVLGPDVLLLDRGGGLFRLTRDLKQLSERVWLAPNALRARPLETGSLTTYLLPAADGKTAYEIAYSQEGAQLLVRKYEAGAGGKAPAVEERVLNWKGRSALAGPPALTPRGILLPLANNSMELLPLKEGEAERSGPSWRSPNADDRALGYLVPIPGSPNEFLATDGSNGLTHWQWQQSNYHHVPDDPNDPDKGTRELPARIVAPPLVLPRADRDAPLQVCVADAEGTLTLLEGDDLAPKRRWSVEQLGGKITAGPFLRGKHIGCVVDRKKLVWIDPGQDGPLWQWKQDGGEGIVGEPQLVGKILVVADLAGKFVGLDPLTGKPVGPGYTLQANAAPVATPVAPEGSPQAFVPLSDGTVFLLPLSKMTR